MSIVKCYLEFPEAPAVQAYLLVHWKNRVLYKSYDQLQKENLKTYMSMGEV